MIKKLTVFTYSGRFSTRRKASNGAAGDEAMVLASAEESDAADEVFVANRKLLEYVNTAKKFSLKIL